MVLRRPQATIPLVLGGVVAACGLFSGLGLLKRSLGFLTYDGQVGPLSGGETGLLRVLAVLAGLALAGGGVAWPALADRARAGARSLSESLSLLSPQACRRAFCRLTEKRGRPYTIALVLVFGAGVAIRTAHLGQPMHDDESGGFLNWSSQPLYVSVTKYGAPGNHVLHTVLQAVSCRLFGDSAGAIRLPAFISGLCLMPAAFVLFLRMLGPWPALLALSMVAASDLGIEYAANARGYSLAALLAIWQTHALVTALPSRSWRRWLGAALPGGLAIYTLPTMVYLSTALWITACIVWWTEHRRDPRGLLRPVAFGLLSLGIAAALYSPMVLVGGVGALTDSPFYRPLDPGVWPLKAGTITYHSVHLISLGVMPILLLVVLAAVGFVALRRVDRRWPVLWASLFLAPVVMAYVQQVVPFARTFTYLQPFVYALVGLGMWELFGRSLNVVKGKAALRPAASLVVCGVMLLSIGVKFARAQEGFLEPVSFPQARAVARLVADHFPPATQVFVVDRCERPFLFYLRDAEGLRRRAGREVPDSAPAIWVRCAAAVTTPRYRWQVDELCRRFRVGPVLRRLGQAEIVALTPRPQGRNAQADGPPPCEWGD